MIVRGFREDCIATEFTACNITVLIPVIHLCLVDLCHSLQIVRKTEDYEVKGKVSQNTTSFIGVNETTCFGLLGGHHQVCKVLRD